MARKSSLREFQRNVAERLRDPSKLRASASKLGFQVDQENWFVSLADVAEVIPVPAFVPVPQTKHWFQGVANVRGKLFAVADFSAFQGGPATAQGVERRVVLLNERLLEASGIVVSRMLGLRNPETFERLQVCDAGRPWLKTQYRDQTGTQWCELDVAALAKSAAFLEVAVGPPTVTA
ncbi:MAG: chemotaxis protein CheW [Aeromicrobium sp.]|nr:chemotaxis protein CheW [Burkholderiales bacterium]